MGSVGNKAIQGLVSQKNMQLKSFIELRIEYGIPNTDFFKGTLCKNYSHLVVQLYIAFKLIVLACSKTTVGSMCQEAVS